ncbi:MAG TPA: tRNA (adenosine(37)-N6)-dimethylallyltransferase MiaA [Planctomycetia bacterium]|nr:tRNA (adenosine(37)-N6)-dimethylallyltransferase MiaA [Planctomycetia bacterium]
MTWAADCWFLVGATASGKSAAGLELAERADGEIIALDSMTLYRGMDIGTAKPSPADRAKVPHHLVDALDPSESASVAWYLREAERIAGEARARGKRPIFVGGTPLYLKACLRGMFEGPPADLPLRAELEAEAAAKGVATLHAQLAKVDPAAAARIMPGDLRRIIRALEVERTTGTPIAELQKQFDKPADPAPKVACLAPPTAVLWRRIETRLDAMLAGGWIEETESLFHRAPAPARECRQAVGYHEIGEFLGGRMTRDAMRERILHRTRQFSKRQRTWFRHLEEITMMPIEGTETPAELSGRLAAFFEPEEVSSG